MFPIVHHFGHGCWFSGHPPEQPPVLRSRAMPATDPALPALTGRRVRSLGRGLRTEIDLAAVLWTDELA